ncbi:sulfite oxidase heme-binding subunit YedZ [Arcobacter sp. F2176]|uniref:sulfite oxidase heme-binding subunit YedZ n=1 Tax=Arcobacter sp. F2176 TaxID=2044511 RepID=UPI00100AA623|nr:ferric reductase-like transmembrane domain-containing protein [Arcobacter sp. F2176]RXJ81766.1 ferric reductase [Arcobacter sp. F2176]
MKVIIFILLILPSFILGYEVFIVQDLIDPIKYIYTVTGAIAMVLLFFSITISLIRKKVNLISYRKMIGLFGFYYVFLHFLNFVILDMEVDFAKVINETLEKPFIYLGMISFVLLIFMALTSFGKLFKLYFKYHKVIYIVLILSTIHFVMAQKALSIPQMGYLLIMIIIGFLKLKQRVKLN